MESVGESSKNMNELFEICQKLGKNASYDDMKTLQRAFNNAFKQKEMEFQQKEGESILPMTAELGKVVDSLIVEVKEASARDEKMEVDSPRNVLVSHEFARAGGSSGLYYLNREENGIKLRRKVEELEIQRVDLLSKWTSEITSGKILKTEFRLWLAEVKTIIAEAKNLENKLAEGRFMEYEALGRSLMGKMEEVDELYNKGSFAESIVAEEAAGEKSESSQKFKTKDSSRVVIEGGKVSIVGMGGVGETTIETKGPLNFTFGNIQL